MQWQCRNRQFECGNQTLIMGILNVTPDSFSDGGKFCEVDSALVAARNMLEEGADIIDIGGESTRPGAVAVDEQEELRRVLPVIEALVAETDAVISIDTSKARVAEAAMQAGAHIINDVTALRADENMGAVAAKFGAGVVLMHMQGTPRTMQNNPQYENIVDEVCNFLKQRLDAAVTMGISRENLALDPGIGFGKTTEHNLQLIAESKKIKKLGCPLLVGLSRKRFIGTVTGMSVEDRLAGSLAGLTCSILAGADIMRVHDVAPSHQAAAVADAIRDKKNRVLGEEV